MPISYNSFVSWETQPTSTVSPISSYIPLCECPMCTRTRDSIQAQTAQRLAEQHLAELNNHFTPPSIAFNVTENPLPIKEELMIPNPLPEPATSFIPTRLTDNSGYTFETDTFDGFDFQGASLQNANLSNRTFIGTNFAGCNLNAASLNGSTFINCNFSEAMLTDAILNQVTFDTCSMRLARFNYSDVSGASFECCDLSYVNFDSVYGGRRANLGDNNTFYYASGIHQCAEECGYAVLGGRSGMYYMSDTGEYLCSDCYHADDHMCEYCNDNYRDVEEHYLGCSDRRPSNLREYSYRPYRYQPKGNYPEEPLMGVELEVGGNEFDLASAIANLDPNEDHLYCKQDGSVEGIEVVTHPMTLNWAKSDFDFKQMIHSLRAASGYSDDGYGLHVHVSRNAFRGTNSEGVVRGKRQPRHQMTWLTFMYRNSNNITNIARRTSSQWADWNTPVKGELRKKAAGPDGYSARYLAINCQNDRTYEVRVFRSTLNYTEFMAAMELVDASVRYTGTLTSNDILKGKGLEWSQFHNWATKQGARYSNLLNQMKVQGTV